MSTTKMADVWLATDDVLERQVVVKLLAPDADRPRFEREARAAAALAHPNIVQLFDYGEDEGRPYMVLEYLPGGTLDERLPEGVALQDDETRRVATDVASGLAHAHEHGVVHRDLKPGNVLFDAEGRAKVTDFGIARVVGSDTLTEDGTVLGTAAYISPEQVSGGPVTPATDVYAFGVLLYRLLSGRFPFESENAMELARMHRDLEPPPLHTFRPDAPADLSALAATALAKDPAARPADGAALLSAIEGAGGTLVADAATVRLPVVRKRRNRLAYLLAGMLLLGAGLAVAVVLVSSHSSSAPAVSTHDRHTTTHHTQSTVATSTSTPSTSTRSTTTQTTTPPATTLTPPPPPPTTSTTPTTTAPTTTAPTTTGP